MEFDAKLAGLRKSLMPALSVAAKPLIKDLYEADKVLLKVEKDSLKVYANNGRMLITSKLSNMTVEDVDFDFHKDGLITVNSEDLGTALNSFNLDETVKFLVDEKSNELQVIKKDDIEQFQTIPLLAKNIDIPDTPDKFTKTLTIDRDLFVNSANTISFAIGFEDQVPQFLYWLLRVASEKKVRFIASNKNRFAVCEVEYDKVVTSKPATTNLLFAKEHTLLMIKILESVDDKSITIKQADPSKDNSGLIIETLVHAVSMANTVPNAQWPDENRILNYDFTHKVVSKVEDWRNANKGSLATFKDGAKDNRPHKVTLKFDYKAKNIKVVVDDIKKSTRKVAVVDAEYPDKDVIDSLECVSPYLQEINKLGHKDGFVQIEFSSKKKPVLMRFTKEEKVTLSADAINVRSHGYNEKITMFFAPLGG